MLAMKGIKLFELLKEKTFILNPFSEYRKELFLNEIEQILDEFS